MKHKEKNEITRKNAVVCLRQIYVATEALNTEEIQVTLPCFCASVANSFLPQAEYLNNPCKSVQLVANLSAAGIN